jgi:hypothetical protein
LGQKVERASPQNRYVIRPRPDALPLAVRHQRGRGGMRQSTHPCPSRDRPSSGQKHPRIPTQKKLLTFGGQLTGLGLVALVI